MTIISVSTYTLLHGHDNNYEDSTMYESMSTQQIDERIIENAERGIRTTNRLEPVCDDKHLIDRIKECFEQIVEDSELKRDSVAELNFND